MSFQENFFSTPFNKETFVEPDLEQKNEKGLMAEVRAPGLLPPNLCPKVAPNLGKFSLIIFGRKLAL